MALLDKRITKEARETKKQNKSSKISVEFDVNPELYDIERFSIFVLKALLEKNIPPTPENYKIYFEKLLEKKSLNFQKSLEEILEFESDNYDENRVEIEKEVKKIFVDISNIINVVNSIYKKINRIKLVNEEMQNELQKSDNVLVIKNILSNFESRLNGLVELIDSQLEELKDRYKKIAQTFKAVESSTIFDTRFGVYNKRYFLEQSNSEKQKVLKFKHESCIVAIEISKESFKALYEQKDRMLLLKIVAKMLLRTSRRNDVISYFGDNIFIMLLRHTALKNAKMACERIRDMFSQANIIINDNEIEVKENMGISVLKGDRDIEESLSCAFDALEVSQKENKTYAICKADKEQK